MSRDVAFCAAMYLFFALPVYLGFRQERTRNLQAIALALAWPLILLIGAVFLALEAISAVSQWLRRVRDLNFVEWWALNASAVLDCAVTVATVLLIIGVIAGLVSLLA